MPLEWWDAHWIRDRIAKPLADAGITLAGITDLQAAPPARSSGPPRPRRAAAARAIGACRGEADPATVPSTSRCSARKRRIRRRIVQLVAKPPTYGLRAVAPLWPWGRLRRGPKRSKPGPLR
jgi:hypothetical protein